MQVIPILCAKAGFLRSSEIRWLTWSDVIFPSDLRLMNQVERTAVFKMHSPENENQQPQIRVFNDRGFVAILQNRRQCQFRAMHLRNQQQPGNLKAQLVCLYLCYKDYNVAIKTSADYFGPTNAHFSSNGARLGAATAEFGVLKDVEAVKSAGGWKKSHSAEFYIPNGAPQSPPCTSKTRRTKYSNA